jgi:two-component system response regulator PilR (NtrC family)
MSANVSKTEHDAPGSLADIELLISEMRIDEATEALETFIKGRRAPQGSIEDGWISYLNARIAVARTDYSTALSLANKSFDILRMTTENSKIGKVLLLLSKTYLALGDLEKTESYGRDALSSFRRIRDRAGIFSCYNKLAYVHFVRGEYDKSAKYLKEAIGSLREHAIENKKAAVSLARYSANLARIYILSGKWDEASDLLEDCVVSNRRHGVKRSLILNFLSLGYLATLRRSQRYAWHCFEEVRHLLSEQAEFRRESVILKEYVGNFYLEFGEYDKALDILNRGMEEANQIAPDSALVSQIGRLRAEVFLSLGRASEALSDAERALSVARRLGEKLEIAHSLRVIGLAKGRSGHKSEGIEFLRQAEDAFSDLGDRFERARALLDFASEGLEHRSEYDYRRAEAHIVTARFTFQELESRYYQAQSWIVEAGLHERYDHLDLAMKAIEEAEELFASLGETERTHAARQIRQSLEKKLVDNSLSPRNEFLLFKDYLNESEYKDIKQGSLEENVDVLARRVGADRALVMVYDGVSEQGRILASVRVDEDHAKLASRGITPLQIGALEGRPVFSTAPEFVGMNGFSNILAGFPEATSLVVLPLRISDRARGVMILVRDSASLSGRFFGQKDLNFAVAFSDVIAFKAIESAQRELAEDNRRLRQQLGEKCSFPNVITRDEGMLRMLERVVQVKDSPISILIEGETGCGKDLIAKTIHYNSIRSKKRFVSVNCAALPESLLESELFGHRRGAYTGADRDKAGHFEEADGGTFFLDEIGEMPLSIQVKLLRVLEEQEVVRLGETSGRKVDVRVVSATNRDLKTAMDEGVFRQDLYYRLSAFTLKIPPLRKRRHDIPLLVEHFIQKSVKQVELSQSVMKRLIEYSWPGNVRELENEIKKLVLLCDDGLIVDDSLLSKKFHRIGGPDPIPAVPEVEMGDNGFSLYGFIEEFEKKYLVKALEQHRWVKKHAAAALKIPESTLRLKMKQYGISRPS